MARHGDTQQVDFMDDPAEPLVVTRTSRAPWVLFVLALAAGAGVAGWLLYRLEAVRAEAASAKVALEDTRTKLDQARAEGVALGTKLDRAESEKKDLAAVKDELSQDVQAKEAELAKLRGEFDELQEKMKAEIDKGNIRLSQEQGRIKVDMVDEILFEVGEASISRQGEGVLSRVGAILSRMKDKQIQVSGHTDDQPISVRLKDRFPTNWDLSAARAITVVRFLEEKAGVPGRRLVAAAHSQYAPLTSNRTEQGRAHNRRIEILLTPKLDADRPEQAAAPAPARPAAAHPAAKKAPAVKAGHAPAKKKAVAKTARAR